MSHTTRAARGTTFIHDGDYGGLVRITPRGQPNAEVMVPFRRPARAGLRLPARAPYRAGRAGHRRGEDVNQDGFSTPKREAARMLRDGGVSAQRAREWMAREDLTDDYLERDPGQRPQDSAG